jgi:hypothetical protein
MGAFAKIAGSSASGGGNFFRAGNYMLLVESVMLDKKFAGDTFIAETRIMKAEPNGEVDEKGAPITPNKVGTTASLVCELDKHDSAGSNAKAFALGVLGALGYTEEQITEQVMTEICDKRIQPLRGFAVEMRTVRKINQGRKNEANKGKPLDLPRWYSVAQTKENIKEQRAWLDANKPGVAAAPAAAPAPAPTPAPAQTPVANTPAPAGGVLGNLLG